MLPALPRSALGGFTPGDSAYFRVCWGETCQKNNDVLLDVMGSYAQWMLCSQIKFDS
jgi:hypothetical protein